MCNADLKPLLLITLSNLLFFLHCLVLQPTDAPTDTPTEAPTGNPTDNPTEAPTPAIKSWDLELTSVNTDFDMGSTDEITLSYKIGKDRSYQVFMLHEDCKTAINGATVTKEESTSDIVGDAANEKLKVSVDIVKSSIAGSNIWVAKTASSNDKVVKLCAKVELLSGSNVIKKLERVIEVDLDFKNDFQTIQNATFDQISLDTNNTDADVDNYIKACTCDGFNADPPFICNTNSLGVDDFLNVCVESQDPEMEINYLDSLKMKQGINTLKIVLDKKLEDNSISSLTTRADDSGVHVASVIPASFFRYDSTGTATVSGVIYLKLKGSRRRLAVEMDDSSSTHARALQSAGDQESAFSMEVQLEKNELITADSNGATYEVMSGAIRGVTAVVTAATFLMW